MSYSYDDEEGRSGTEHIALFGPNTWKNTLVTIVSIIVIAIIIILPITLYPYSEITHSHHIAPSTIITNITNITNSSAVVHGIVNPNHNDDISYFWSYHLSTGNITHTTPHKVENSSVSVLVSYILENLESNSLYYVNLVVNSHSRNITGDPVIFVTK
eukprot:TRINITY_DN1193_c0_g4_i1.p1 TRINITY_DN1193_c0_g4~~TRINITY_DN1193_c0_g4_i1.p1  ORF type:complete len:158 (-),score=0.59 TRINITY_DN1193_c0_g4_i1:22-495(-)